MMAVQGSAGGHNGLDDVVKRLDTENVPRLRVGIGPPAGGAPSILFDRYVLSTFGAGEQTRLPFLLEFACEVLRVYLHRGVEMASLVANNTTLEDFVRERKGVA